MISRLVLLSGFQSNVQFFRAVSINCLTTATTCFSWLPGVLVDLCEASPFPFLYTGLRMSPFLCGMTAEGTQELDLALKGSIFLEEYTECFPMLSWSCIGILVGLEATGQGTPGHEEGLRNLP